jgi:8-hydroxy-5-deazaflavin:NADPH oxidoreductase
MRIAIVGAGNADKALSAAAVAAGHDVAVSATTRENAEEAAAAAGARAAANNADAVNGAEIVVFALPHAAVAEVANELGSALAGKVVVDASNPLNTTSTDLVTVGTSSAEDLQRQLPDASVIKAFNTTFASRHDNPTEGDEPLDAFIAGDDADAKAKVGELATSLGYRVIDAGSLRMARSLEEMAFLNITLNATNGWAWQSGWKLVGPTGEQ